MKLFKVFLILFLSYSQSFASHLPKGHELTYKHLSGFQYEVVYRLFMDCRSELSSFDTTRRIVVQSSCFGSLIMNLKLVSGYPIPVDESCYTALGQCNLGGILGAAEYKFTDTINLPGACHDWKFSREECCMVIANSNIYDPVGTLTTDFFSVAFLNNTISNINSSAQFFLDPIYKTCIGENICINYNVWDPDGDSLIYELIPPMQGLSDSLIYDSPFSSVQPLTTFNPIQFNSATGSMCFKPVNQEMTYWNLRVSEFRNHSLIGYAEREMMLSSELCNNHIPILSGLNSSSNFSANLVYGQNYCFTIQCNDVDLLDSNFINWNNLPNGMVVNINPGQQQSIDLCWTPTIQDVRSTPYTIILNGRDNSCPNNGVNSAIYELTVTLPLTATGIANPIRLLEIYPNPSKKEFRIRTQNLNFPGKIYLEDLSGRIIIEKTVLSEQEIINPEIPAGIYIIKFQDKEFNTLVKQFIITK